VVLWDVFPGYRWGICLPYLSLNGRHPVPGLGRFNDEVGKDLRSPGGREGYVWWQMGRGNVTLMFQK